MDSQTNAHLLKYDSNYGNFQGSVEVRENAIVVDGTPIRVFSERDPHARRAAIERTVVPGDGSPVSRAAKSSPPSPSPSDKLARGKWLLRTASCNDCHDSVDDHMKKIDGKALAAQIESELAEQVAEFIQNNAHEPTLAAVLVGDDPASSVYVKNKRAACERHLWRGDQTCRAGDGPPSGCAP